MLDIIKVIIVSLVSLIVLFLLTKMMGEKQISQMSLFDYIIGISFGSIAAEMATELENPQKPLCAMIVYAVFAVIISFVTNKSIKLRKIINGRPIILMEKGKIYRANLKKARMDINDLLTLCRYMGYFDISQLETVLLEHNGALSVLPKAQYMPATPSDLNVQVNDSGLWHVFISDGVVLRKNLQKAGKNEQWLKNKLKEQGYDKESEIMLAQCDVNDNLDVYPIINKPLATDMFE